MTIPQAMNYLEIFGENEGVWEYFDINGEHLGWVVRHPGKIIKPWIIQNGKLVSRWFKDDNGDTCPPVIYNLQYLKTYPERPVLVVEGEKTASAAQLLFTDFNVVTWMGGANRWAKVDWSPLVGRKVYLLPDNDEAGFKAMKGIQKKLPGSIYVDLSDFGLSKGWDIADLEGGEIDFQDVYDAVVSAKTAEIVFDTQSYPFMSDSKKPYALDVSDNLKYLLNSFGIIVRWNMLKRDREIFIPGKVFYNEEAANESLTLITNLAVQYQFNIRRIDKHLDAISFADRYHPIRDWILNKPVSDHSAFESFLTVLKTTDDKLSQLLLRRWLISAVATVFNESNYRAQGVLVLQGAGGWHKTSFIASLVPHEFDAVYTGASLDPSNKDSVLTLAEYWIAELGELGSTFKKSDINKLKAHITQEKDTVRRPFAAKNSKMLRRTIFAASVNEENFLVDETGNRRWWVISLAEKINVNHGIDMQQVWRAAYDLWMSGDKSYLDYEEVDGLNEANKQFELADPYIEKIVEKFDFNQDCDRWISPTIVLEMIGIMNPSRAEATKMGATLAKLGVKRKRTRTSAVYLMPILKQLYR